MADKRIVLAAVLARNPSIYACSRVAAMSASSALRAASSHGRTVRTAADQSKRRALCGGQRSIRKTLLLMEASLITYSDLFAKKWEKGATQKDIDSVSICLIGSVAGPWIAEVKTEMSACA